MNIAKKILSIILSLIIFCGQPAAVIAYDVPTAPESGSVTASAESPSPPSAPSAPEAPTYEPSQARDTPPPQPTQPVEEQTASGPTGAVNTQPTDSPLPTPTVVQTSGSGTSGTSTSTIVTGDTNNNGLIINSGGSNIGTGAVPTGSSGINTASSGTRSDNAVNQTKSNTASTIQDNTATVDSRLTQSSVTGRNVSDFQTGTDSTIISGDANVSGTIINALNTNVDGVMVSEFNVADDQQGDIVLDFASHCISGCQPGSDMVQATGNGVQSQTALSLDENSSDKAFQSNDAAVGNDMTLVADTGSNASSYNTDGNTIIKTGDANVSANSLTFANNNISGNVVYGVVNIYGDLVGDIIFPEEVFGTCCNSGNVTAETGGNGSGSANTTRSAETSTTESFQSNDATIENTLVLDAQTGANDTSANTGGDSVIKTGSANIDTNVVNVANSNVTGNWWLVLVNEAGNWVGRLFGGTGTENMAGSAGTEFSVAPSGEVTISNGSNGSDSANTAAIQSDTATQATQHNNAEVANTLSLTANTGSNASNYNTGGNTAIVTGDANIVANLVNFVNNNITGGGKLFVTVVNVFGSWVGDFIGPGEKKQSQDTSQTHEPTPSPVVSAGKQEQSGNRTQTRTSVSVVRKPDGNRTAKRVLGVTTARKQTRNITLARYPDSLDPQPTKAILTDNTGSILSEALISPQPTAMVAGKRVVKLNLSYIVLVLPGIFLYFLLKRIRNMAARSR
jgi:hypothetical protein